MRQILGKGVFNVLVVWHPPLWQGGLLEAGVFGLRNRVRDRARAITYFLFFLFFLFSGHFVHFLRMRWPVRAHEMAGNVSGHFGRFVAQREAIGEPSAPLNAAFFPRDFTLRL